MVACVGHRPYSIRTRTSLRKNCSSSKVALEAIIDAAGAGLDTSSLYVAFATHDVADIIGSAITFALDAVTTYIDTLSWLNRIALGATVVPEEGSNAVDFGLSEYLSIASAAATGLELYYNIESAWLAS